VFPPILELLIVADLTLTTVTLLAPHLTDENCAAAVRPPGTEARDPRAALVNSRDSRFLISDE